MKVINVYGQSQKVCGLLAVFFLFIITELNWQCLPFLYFLDSIPSSCVNSVVLKPLNISLSFFYRFFS